ncbi:MFS transporter [Pseudactinotalea sp. Z1748]|uniref:MFS transporter n=1 Tax=Pseudactinotalea sp. Z1748 TaxID=3413027 RepID=UPI003C7D061D
MSTPRPDDAESEAPTAVADAPVGIQPASPTPGQHPPVKPSLRERLPLAMRHQAFRRLTLAWVSTNIGDSALFLVLAIWVRELTGSDSAAGLVFAALGLPALLAPLAGQLADRVSRRRLLIATNVGIGLVVASLLTVQDASGLWLIYAVTFCYGLAAYLTSAAQSGLLRDMLNDDELPGANGLFTTIDQGLRLISPLLGTGLFVLTGPHTVVVLTATCFLVTAAVLTTVRLTESPAPQDTDAPGALRQLGAGFGVLWGDPTLRLITIVLAIAVGITGFLNVLVFPILEQGLGVGSQALGIVVTVQGVGAVIGGATSAAILKRIGERRLVGTGLGVLSGGLVGSLAIITIVPADGAFGLLLISLTLATSGLGIPWFVVGASNYRIRVTPPGIQGRASAAMNMVFNAPQTAATVAGAGIILVMDYRILLALCVVALIGCALACRPWAAIPQVTENSR